jgi:Lipocalin-like domain
MMLRDALVGTWTLVSYTERSLPDGPVTYPHGPDALGLIMYTPDGYMSAQIMTRSRPCYDRPVASGGTAVESAAAATGYLAYSGPYSVDVSAGDMHHSTGDIQHQVMVSLLPNWLGHTQIRHSQLDGEQLTLSAKTPLPNGTTMTSTLVWARAPSQPSPG